MNIYVIDNFLSEDTAKEFHDKFFSDKSWSYDWNRGLDPQQEQKWNWHRSVATDKQNLGDTQSYINNLDPIIRTLWDYTDSSIFDKFGVKHKMDRYYSNSHTYGIDGSIHTDDGNVTALYYPCMDWDVSWEGGTSFYNKEMNDCIKYVSYKFNRMILFDAKIPHRAMPVTRECYELRTSVVFKASMDTNDQSYFEWYNNRK